MIHNSPAYRFGQPTAQGVSWSLRRNCSVTPRQLGGAYLGLCLLSLGVALFFWLQGATLVLPFALLELAAVALALLVHARHATDGECISLCGGRLVVEQETSGRIQRSEFAREWVRVEPRDDASHLIDVRAGGRCVTVGRFLRPDLRPLLAREIRQALRGV